MIKKMKMFWAVSRRELTSNSENCYSHAKVSIIDEMLHERNNRILLLAIAVIAISLLLKIWGSWNVSSQDEYIEILEALRVCSGNFNFERWIKRVYLYILSVEYGVYFVVGYLFGVFNSTMDFAHQVVRDMLPLFLLARWTSAILATGTVFFAYRICELLHSRTSGVVVALFLTFNPISNELAHYARVDSSLSFFTTTGIFYILKFYGEDNRWNAIIAGLMTGLAVQCKPQGVVLVLSFFTAAIFKFYPKALTEPKTIVRGCAPYVIGGLVGFIAGNPLVVVAFPDYVQSILSLKQVYESPLSVHVPEMVGYLTYYYDIQRQLGFALFYLTLLSVPCVLIMKRAYTYIIILAYLAGHYILMGGSNYVISSSYMLSFYPLLFLFPSVVLVELSTKLVRFSRILLIAALVLFISPSFVQVVKFQQSVSGKNTRVVAKEWIETNIPLGSKIVMDSGRNLNTFAPMISSNKASILRTINKTKADIQGSTVKKFSGLVDKKGLMLYELMLENIPEVSYDITSTVRGEAAREISYYRENGYEYAILSKEVRDSFMSGSGQKFYPEGYRFYSTIFDELELVKVIEPTNRNNGDTFYVFSFLRSGI